MVMVIGRLLRGEHHRLASCQRKRTAMSAIAIAATVIIWLNAA